MMDLSRLHLNIDSTDECFYRYEDVRYSNGMDMFDNPNPGYSLRVQLSQYPVIKYTPKGAWINVYGDKKFVLLSAKKRYACPTKEEALECFMYRKKRQLSILNAKVRQVEHAIQLATNGVDGIKQSMMLF